MSRVGVTVSILGCGVHGCTCFVHAWEWEATSVLSAGAMAAVKLCILSPCHPGCCETLHCYSRMHVSLICLHTQLCVCALYVSAVPVPSCHLTASACGRVSCGCEDSRMLSAAPAAGRPCTPLLQPLCFLVCVSVAVSTSLCVWAGLPLALGFRSQPEPFTLTFAALLTLLLSSALSCLSRQRRPMPSLLCSSLSLSLSVSLSVSSLCA